MNLKGLLIITISAVAIIILFKIFWDGSGKDMKSGQADSLMVKSEKELKQEPARIYDEAEASGSIAAKYVEIWPVKAEDFNYHGIEIDAMGYREIRVFAHLSVDEYRTNPLPKEALLKVGFGYELKGMGTSYARTTFKQEVTAYIEGFVIEKVYGKKLKLSVDADNLPKGKYTLRLSYYLLP
jgi:hypothetical protein